MSDNFITLSNRLLNRAPSIGIVLAGQLINDSWQAFQARRDWSWRRKSSTFAPPTLYSFGWASTNVSTGNATLITGMNTAWTPTMIGSQIRIGGLLYPYYTIIAYISPTALLIDQPWAGVDVTAQAYQILQCYYPVPADFGYFEVVVSIKDGYRLYTQLTEAELAVCDPQRSTQGQTYAVAFRDFSSNYGGVVGPVIAVTSPSDPTPISTTTLGFSYPTNATYIVQVVVGGVTGTATFQWMRAGQSTWQPIQVTSDQPQDLSDGVQVYWPDINLGLTWNQATKSWDSYTQTWNSLGSAYVAGDLFIINCQALVTSGVPRYELWPAPTYAGYLYPFIYFTKETALTAQNPTLPPPVANRGEILLEMALEKCATFPGQDIDHPNPYFSLQLATYHRARYEEMLIPFENNDQNIAISNITWADWPFAGPWEDGHWQATHAPFL